MRLAKYLAHAGVASRRAAEGLVADGRVAVDGSVVTDPARDVDEHRAVTLDGRPVAPEARELHMLNKPAGVVSTARDTHRRPTVTDLVPSARRLYPVGRLDADTTGLILLTNDGELANRLTHPRYEVEKLYRAEVVPRPVEDRTLRMLREGVELEDGPTLPARVAQPAPGVLEITLREGRKRQVRRMCEAVGHRVVRLQRVAFGPLRLGGLEEGGSRRLSEDEVDGLRRAGEAASSGPSEGGGAPGEPRAEPAGGPAVSAPHGDRRVELDRAKRYPYAAPRSSFVLAGDREYELLGDDGSRQWLDGLAGARVREPGGALEVPLAELRAGDLEPEALRSRIPVLAYGANRTPEALERKRFLPGFPADSPIVVLRALLRELDVVYSAHVSPYGSVGATLQHSPGTTAEVCVTLLTADQLAALGETEHNYTLEELEGVDLELEGGGRLDRVCSYVSRHGCLVLEGSEVSLAAIPAQGRRFPALTEPDVLAAVAARLGHRDGLDAFILENVDDPDLAATRTRDLRRDARPLARPTAL